jgi:hypothetical protein
MKKEQNEKWKKHKSGSISDRKSIETRGYLICTRGVAPKYKLDCRVFLMLFLFCIQRFVQKYKHVFYHHYIKSKETVINVPASEYNFSIVISLNVIEISKSKKNWDNQRECSRQTMCADNLYLHELCLYWYTIKHVFKSKVSKLWYNSF